MTTPLVRLADVSFSYGHRKVLSNVTLDILPGSTTAILGPNGAGKTTLLHLVLGWLRPSSGRVHLEGRPLSSFSRRDMGKTMGLVPQSEHVPFEYSVLEYILLGRAPHIAALAAPGPVDLEKACWALARVGLEGFEDRTITTLSGGERELTLVARALAQEPRLLLLDEPTSHLDLKNKRRMAEVLRELTQAGATVLLTTHEPDLAAAVATDLVLMGRGRLLRAGPLAEVLSTEGLSVTYDTSVRVVEANGHRVVIWD